MTQLLSSQASYTHDMLQAAQVDSDTDIYDAPEDYELDIAISRLVNRARWVGSYSIAVDPEAVKLGAAYPGWRHTELRDRLVGAALQYGLAIQAG